MESAYLNTTPVVQPTFITATPKPTFDLSGLVLFLTAFVILNATVEVGDLVFVDLDSILETVQVAISISDSTFEVADIPSLAIVRASSSCSMSSTALGCQPTELSLMHCCF